MFGTPSTTVPWKHRQSHGKRGCLIKDLFYVPFSLIFIILFIIFLCGTVFFLSLLDSSFSKWSHVTGVFSYSNSLSLEKMFIQMMLRH